MKKKGKTNIIKKLFGGIYSIIDKIIITPISKIAYFFKDRLSFNSGFIDRILNKPNVLLYLSLILAFVCFYIVDKKVIGFSNTNAIVLSNQPVSVEYNEEAYVVEGLPDGVNIILTGRKSDLYLAQDLSDHKVTLNLSNYGVGTHKVALEYNKPINTLNYELNPGTVTVVIYPKVSQVRSLSIDVINTDKLPQTLVVSNVVLDRDEVIIKSYQEKLDKVASVKAIIDVNALNATKSDTYTLENVKLVAYDENGKELKDIEIVPENVTASVVITSPSKTVPLKIVPKGEIRSGSAISSITSSVTSVTVYADESILNELKEIELEIDVNNLSESKVYQMVINKPSGARSISETSVTITVTMESETSKDYSNISIETRNLDPRFKVMASSEQDANVTVTVKGVQSLLNELDNNYLTSIKAYIDLKGITEAGPANVPVFVEGDDLRLTYTSKTKNVQVIIIEAN